MLLVRIRDRLEANQLRGVRRTRRTLSPLVAIIIFGTICGVAVYVFARWLARRTALRDFARAHALQYRGVLPSDKYVPYTQFYSVRNGMLLYNAMEGMWDGFAIALFDVPLRGGPGTSAIVTVPHDCS